MRRWTRDNLLPLLVGIILGVSGAVTTGVVADRSGTSLDLPLEQLRTFSEVFNRVKSDYVDDIDSGELVEDAIRGMLGGLDPHSTYLDPQEYQELQSGTRGEFGGLGLEVGREDGFVKVIAPIDDTPAQKAGIEAGDLIIRIDGDSTKDMGLSEAVRRMRGEPGTEIELTVVREGEDAPFTVTIERDIIRVTSVRSRVLEDGFGYIRISQFQSRTGRQLLDALESMNGSDDGPLRGLVLDLRNNPGGVLQAAVAVSDAFLREGRIVYTEGRRERTRMEFDATPGDTINGAPVVVLVNGGSASASEIVAGALQDHRRAVLMGTNTFGKGSVQSILPLEGGAAVKLTTAKYFTPSGRAIQEEGIEPDVLLEGRPRGARGAGRDGDDGAAGEPGGEARQQGETADQEDYAVREALNLLKGLTIFQREGDTG